MYIVAIAWLYVTVLMALTETNVTAGILTFLLYGLAPLALLMWLAGYPARRRRRAQSEGDCQGPDEATPDGE
jgi:membrane protein implicated in regulation of membrane protease activity